MTVDSVVERDLRADVAEVLVRYATAIDRCDWELFRSCFTEDVVADYGRIGVWHGVEALTRWAIETHTPMGGTMHRITNVVVRPSARGVTARSYYDTIALQPDKTLRTHAMGYYDDELLDTDNGWKISRRTVAMVYLDTKVGARESGKPA